jgi:hypothetical protein
MFKTDFATASTHLHELLGIDLTKRLLFSNAGTLRDFSVVGSLVVVYRYAEALGKKLVVHDMTVGGHESHLLGTELDFDVVGKRKDPMTHLRVVGDLLRLRAVLRPDLEAFRVGLYFDVLSNTEADTLAKFEEKYGGGKTASSMHLGVRYKWASDEYRGKPLPGDAIAFGMWGRGKRTFGYSDLWVNRIRSWDVGFLKGQAEGLARRTIATDFRALDANPPPLAATEHFVVAG